MNKQAIVLQIEKLSKELCAINSIYETVNVFLSSPVSKSQAADFFKQGIKDSFISQEDKNRTLSKLTINPSIFNVNEIDCMVFSMQSKQPRVLVNYISSQAKKILLSILNYIDIINKPFIGDSDETAIIQLKKANRDILLLNEIFQINGNEIVSPDELENVVIKDEEDALYETNIAQMKNALMELCCLSSQSDVPFYKQAIFNINNWESVKSIISTLPDEE